MDIMWCKPVADLSRKHHFSNICQQYKQQTGNKNDYSIIDRMLDNRSRCCNPENKNAGIQCIHKKNRREIFLRSPFCEISKLPVVPLRSALVF